MTAIIATACALAGYLAGRIRPGRVAFNAVEDWADRRSSPLGRWFAQWAYGLLLAAAFLGNPARFIGNVRANRRAAEPASQPVYDPAWKDRP